MMRFRSYISMLPSHQHLVRLPQMRRASATNFLFHAEVQDHTLQCFTNVYYALVFAAVWHSARKKTFAGSC